MGGGWLRGGKLSGPVKPSGFWPAAAGLETALEPLQKTKRGGMVFSEALGFWHAAAGRFLPAFRGRES